MRIAVRYTVDIHYLHQYFKERPSRSPYHTYPSKDFFGIVLRTKQPLETLADKQVVLLARPNLGKRQDGSPVIQGFNVDLMGADDGRIATYGLTGDLPEARLFIQHAPSSLAMYTFSSHGFMSCNGKDGTWLVVIQ